jgi:hypothetical protein
MRLPGDQQSIILNLEGAAAVDTPPRAVPSKHRQDLLIKPMRHDSGLKNQ